MRSGEMPVPASSDRAPVADVPVGSLGDGPLYHRPAARPGEPPAALANDRVVAVRQRAHEVVDVGGLGGTHHLVHFHEFFGLHAGVELGCLRAVAAVFGAAAGLDRQQRGMLDLVGIPMLAMHLLGLPHQVIEGQVEQLDHFGAGPAGL